MDLGVIGRNMLQFMTSRIFEQWNSKNDGASGVTHVNEFLLVVGLQRNSIFLMFKNNNHLCQDFCSRTCSSCLDETQTHGLNIWSKKLHQDLLHHKIHILMEKNVQEGVQGKCIIWQKTESPTKIFIIVNLPTLRSHCIVFGSPGTVKSHSTFKEVETG